MTNHHGTRNSRPKPTSYILPFWSTTLEVKLPGRLLVEERAFFRVCPAHVHVDNCKENRLKKATAARNGDVGPDTDPPLVAVLGLVNVGALQHDDPDFVGMGMQRIGKAWIELRKGAIRPHIVITPQNLFLDSRDHLLELRFLGFHENWLLLTLGHRHAQRAGHHRDSEYRNQLGSHFHSSLP